MFAAIRPNDWNPALLMHVAGAMLLVGALVAVAAIGAASLRAPDGGAALTRTAFRGLLLGVLPAFILMRLGAEWIASKEDVDDASWLDVGYIVADGGLVLIVVATVLAGIAARRGARGVVLQRAVLALAGIVLVASLVAAWVMTAKP